MFITAQVDFFYPYGPAEGDIAYPLNGDFACLRINHTIYVLQKRFDTLQVCDH